MYCKKLVDTSEAIGNKEYFSIAPGSHIKNCKAEKGWGGVVWKMTYAVYIEKILIDGK